MLQLNFNHQTPLQKEKNKKRHVIWLLSVLLLIMAMFSLVMAGFLIGRNTDSYHGQMIDTILLGPDPTRELHISGQVLYTDKTPYANGQVELRSNPRITVTDGQGRFFYESAQPGAHTLSVLDQYGNAIAKCEFTISRSLADRPVKIEKLGDVKYAVELSVDVRFIELAVELNDDGGVLKLLPEETAVLEDDGTVTAG
jgi:hypothetical protein